MSTNALTEKQTAAWTEAIARLRVHADWVPENIASWDVIYSDETRPGRGHFVNASYIDGEIYAQILMDVYGYPSVSIADLEWVHADANEECDCQPCAIERDLEETR